MIDIDWLLWCRALTDYAKAASTRVLTRSRRDPVSDMAGETVGTSALGRVQRTTIRKVGYTITGLVIALIFVPLFIIGAYTIVTSLLSW